MARGVFEASSGFCCETEHTGKNLVSVFQEFPTSIDKPFILARGLGAGLAFYGV